MLRRLELLCIAVLASIAISCSSVMVGAIPAHGKLRDISVSDINAALVAFHAMPGRSNWKVGEIEVIGHDEIRLYWDQAGGSYDTMKRVRGKWRHGGGVVVTS